MVTWYNSTYYSFVFKLEALHRGPVGTEDVDRGGSLPQVVHEDLSSGGAHRYCHPVRLDINGGQG